MYASISQDGIRCDSTTFTDHCALLYGCWELNSGPLKEQSVLLTAKSSLKPDRCIFNKAISDIVSDRKFNSIQT